jgi:pimeloyl-ACP methyl ester carboxylesterase
MKTIALLIAITAVPAIAWAQTADQAPYESQYIRLSDDTEGLLLKPKTPNLNAHVAFVFSHPNRDNFKELPGPAIASHGYTVMLVNYRGDRDNPDAPPEDFLPSISDGIAKLRTLPGIDKVVLLAHSGGTHMGTLYENVAEHGPAACQGENCSLRRREDQQA